MTTAQTKEEVISEDPRGNPYLPGQAPTAIRPLINAIDAELAAKKAFGEARDTLLVHKNDLEQACHDFLHAFEKSDDGKKMVYEAAGRRVTINIDEKIKTEDVSDEE